MEHNEVKVWDLFVRVFHWSLVGLFVISYLSGDELQTLHIYSGYAIAVLVLLRLIWGVIGSRYARFSDFVKSPANVIDYLKALRSGSAPHYLGHNPAGGAMILLLLFSLIGTTASGISLDQLRGPQQAEMFSTTAFDDRLGETHGERGEHEDDEHGDEQGEWLEEVHEFFVNLTLLLVAVHILGVIVSGRLHGENLVKAMITGSKPAQPQR